MLLFYLILWLSSMKVSFLQLTLLRLEKQCRQLWKHEYLSLSFYRLLLSFFKCTPWGNVEMGMASLYFKTKLQNPPPLVPSLVSGCIWDENVSPRLTRLNTIHTHSNTQTHIFLNKEGSLYSIDVSLLLQHGKGNLEESIFHFCIIIKVNFK